MSLLANLPLKNKIYVLNGCIFLVVVLSIYQTQSNFNFLNTSLLIFSIITFLMIAALVRNFSKPLSLLIMGAQKIAEGDFAIKLTKQENNEIGELTDLINKIAVQSSIQIGYLNNLPAPVMLVNKEFNIEYMNLAGANLLGVSQKELKGKKCYDFFKTDDCKTEKCSCAQAMKYDRIASEETVSHAGKDDLPIMYTGTPIKNSDGEIVGALEYIADISQIKNFQNYLTKCTSKMLMEMEKFAGGDLSVSLVAENDDEVGKLYNGFNRAVENIADMIRSVDESVQATASAASQISSSTEEMAAGSHEQSAQTSEVASAVEEMSKTIYENSKSTSFAAEAAKNSGEKAAEGGVVVNETIQGMNRISKVVEKSAEMVFSLGQNSDKIGEIIQVIDEIADQTNLLALNAAIEAARAGEQGRGFAVVADEVRKLAERTTKATKEIEVMIKQIQHDTTWAVDSMKEGTKEIEAGKVLSLKAGEVLQEIVESSTKVKDIVVQVAAATEQQSATAEQIGKNITSINSVTNESASGIQQIAQSAESLNQLMDDLKDQISRFSFHGHKSKVNKLNRLANQKVLADYR